MLEKVPKIMTKRFPKLIKSNQSRILGDGFTWTTRSRAVAWKPLMTSSRRQESSEKKQKSVGSRQWLSSWISKQEGERKKENPIPRDKFLQFIFWVFFPSGLSIMTKYFTIYTCLILPWILICNWVKKIFNFIPYSLVGIRSRQTTVLIS